MLTLPAINHVLALSQLEGGALELTTMHPVAVMGPVMGKNISGANHIIRRMLDGDMPAYPNLFIPIVDVRDVARAHILAMTNPGAAGERFLLCSGRPLPMKEIGATIKADLGNAAKRVPTRSIPTSCCASWHSSMQSSVRSPRTSVTPRKPPTRKPDGYLTRHHATPPKQSSPQPGAWSKTACSRRDLALRADVVAHIAEALWTQAAIASDDRQTLGCPHTHCLE